MIEQVLTMKRTAALCLVGAFCSLNAQAQKIQVKGNLVDGTGEPLIGATVKVKGNASVGAVTDFDGNFSISVPSENSTLVFTYVGMKTKEVKMGKKREFKLTLEDRQRHRRSGSRWLWSAEEGFCRRCYHPDHW